MKVDAAMLRSAGAVGPLTKGHLAVEKGAETPAASEGFGAMLEKAMDATNQVQLDADGKIQSFVAGDDIAPHELMIKLSEADTTLRLFTGVVSRAIEAYREISRIDV